MSETKKLLYTVSFQPNIVGNFTPDIIIYKNVSNLKVVLESSGELCNIKQRGGLGARRRRQKNRREMIKKVHNGKEKEENVTDINEKEKEDVKNITKVKTIEEWKKERENKKSS